MPPVQNDLERLCLRPESEVSGVRRPTRPSEGAEKSRCVTAGEFLEEKAAWLGVARRVWQGMGSNQKEVE